MRTLFDFFWTIEQKHPPTPILKVRSHQMRMKRTNRAIRA